MQATTQPSAPAVHHAVDSLIYNSPATTTQPLRPPPSAPCQHCCGEGYLITTGPGYFDPHEECWMPNEDIDPCPTCHGSGWQPFETEEQTHERTEPPPFRVQIPQPDASTPLLRYEEHTMIPQTTASREHETLEIPDWPAQRASGLPARGETSETPRVNWAALYAALSEPFHPSLIRYRAGATNRDKTQAQALPYVDPRAYEDRLNTLVPGDWNVIFEPWGNDRIICCLTIHGVTRSSTGEAGDSPDGIAGTSAEAQALKRACARFGLGRYLYDLKPRWMPYDSKSGRLTGVVR